jgi:hypothetical protein
MTDMPPSESQMLLTHFDWNLQRLNEVIMQEKNDYFMGAALQRFGHTYDITVKVLRSFAKHQGLSCQTDEQCFEIAVANGWMERIVDIKELTMDYQRITEKPKQKSENIHKKLATYHKAFSYIFKQLKKVS